MMYCRDVATWMCSSCGNIREQRLRQSTKNDSTKNDPNNVSHQMRLYVGEQTQIIGKTLFQLHNSYMELGTVQVEVDTIDRKIAYNGFSKCWTSDNEFEIGLQKYKYLNWCIINGKYVEAVQLV